MRAPAVTNWEKRQGGPRRVEIIPSRCERDMFAEKAPERKSPELGNRKRPFEPL
jgi:hypothetical protein